jgi:hypothetical protein
MTDTSHRTYAAVVALVVFLLFWAAVAARPWTTAKADPRLVALQAREQRLRLDAAHVARVVDRRNAAYQAALKARRNAIARARSQAIRAAAQPPPVRIVTLPPLTVTRTS